MLRSDGFKETRAGGYNCHYCTVHYLNVALVLAEKGGGKAEHWPVLEEKGCSPRNKSGMDGSRKTFDNKCVSTGAKACSAEDWSTRAKRVTTLTSQGRRGRQQKSAAAAAAAAISNMLLLLLQYQICCCLLLLLLLRRRRRRLLLLPAAAAAACLSCVSENLRKLDNVETRT
jgi:hypothetical protein